MPGRAWNSPVPSPLSSSPVGRVHLDVRNHEGGFHRVLVGLQRQAQLDVADARLVVAARRAEVAEWQQRAQGEVLDRGDPRAEGEGGVVGLFVEGVFGLVVQLAEQRGRVDFELAGFRKLVLQHHHRPLGGVWLLGDVNTQRIVGQGHIHTHQQGGRPAQHCHPSHQRFSVLGYLNWIETLRRPHTVWR